MLNKTKKSAFGLIETLVASGILAMVVSAVVGLTSLSLRGSASISNEVVANYLAIAAFESVKQIRNSNYIDSRPTTDWRAGLASGTYGLQMSFSDGNPPKLASSPDTASINSVNFTRSITITDIVTDKIKVSTTISWQENSRNKSKTQEIILTNYEPNF